MDFVTLTIEFLKLLSHFVGNYGLGIILLTVLVRLLMWPLGVSQQRSMKTMQMLQPKLKMIQERYKSDPQTMQRKMMEFYKEHKFNPMAGCLPMLIQLPIFILLYSALMSPQFIQLAGDSKFLFINRLDSTLKGTAGISYDGSFSASKNDYFTADKNIKVTLNSGNVLDNVKLLSKKALKVQGDIISGENIDFKIGLDELDLKFSQLEKVKSVEVVINDNTTRELERIEFKRQGDILKASVPTNEKVSNFHFDVFLLIVFFGLTMFVTQKIMMSANKQQQQQLDQTQESIQKMMGTMMPVMLTATFIFIPIPAGVLLYLIASNIFQVIQTLLINKQLEIEDRNKHNKDSSIYSKSNEVIDVTAQEVKDNKKKGW